MHGEAPEFRRCCFCLPLRRGLMAWGYTKLETISYRILMQRLPLALSARASRAERRLEWYGRRYHCEYTHPEEELPKSSKHVAQSDIYALNLLMFAYVIAMTTWFTRRFGGFDAREIAILTAIVTALLIDLSFGIIFIVACHKKSVKLLNISYIYNVVWLGLMLIGMCFQLYVNLKFIYRMWNYIEYRMYIAMDVFFCAGLAFSVLFVQIYLILLLRSEMAKLRNQSLEMQFSNHLASNEPRCTLHNATADQCEGKKQVVQSCCTDEKQVVQDCCTGKNQVCCTDKECNKAKTPA